MARKCVDRREKRGARYLENPPKPRTVKTPIKGYVHYESMGGDLVAFEIGGSHAAITKLGDLAAFMGRPDVVEHTVSLNIHKDARLIVLPSSVLISDDLKSDTLTKV